jgi:hypothetical protein
MSNDTVIDDRLTALEREVADLKLRLNRSASETNWLEQLAGSMEDEPDFAQVLEFGRAARGADKPSDGQL